MLNRFRLILMATILLVLAGCSVDSGSLNGQSPQRTASPESIHWVVELELMPERVADFKELMTEMVTAAETQPGTLVYEWYFSEDDSRCIIIERYRDSAAMMAHLAASGPYTERFLAAAKISRLTILGNLDAATQAALEGLNPNYLSAGEGF